MSLSKPLRLCAVVVLLLALQLAQYKSYAQPGKGGGGGGGGGGGEVVKQDVEPFHAQRQEHLGGRGGGAAGRGGQCTRR